MSVMSVAPHPIDREAIVFCRYLIGMDPDEYAVDRYREAHDANALNLEQTRSRFDQRLVRFAVLSPTCTRIADVFAGVFTGCRLRKKLVLLLAILENSPAHAALFNAPSSSSRLRFLLRGFLLTAGFVSCLAAGLVILVPLYILCLVQGNSQAGPS